MANRQRIPFAACVMGTIGLAWFAGCSSTPSRVEMVDIDPDDAAAQAMSQYDANQDGKLADAELRAVPGIFKWKSLYDADGDGSISESEIVQRLEKWQSDNLGFRVVSARVTLNGQPVPDVEVTITPESYLGPSVKSATGKTNRRGYATLSVAPGDLPEAIQARGIRVQGVYPGTYRIAVKHASGKLPNVAQDGGPLGDEVARDTVDTSFPIDLSTR